MRHLLIRLALLSVLALGTESAVRSADVKGDDLIGKDLNGWEGLKQYWSFKDGALIGSAPEGLKVLRL